MASTSPTLRRVIGVRALALTMVNTTVGAGIFGLPALAARDLGSNAVFAYLACAVLVALVGLCLAEVGSRVSDAGGLYGYAKASHGPVVGAATGHLLWFANGAIGNAAVASLLADTLGVLVPQLAPAMPRALLLLGYYATLVAINVRGTRQGVGFAQLTTIIKLAPLVGFVAFGLGHARRVNLEVTALPAAGALAKTTALVFFAFMGFESGLNTSGEVSAPARTVPRALFVALTLVALLYVSLQAVAQGVLGRALAIESDAPLGAAASAMVGPAGGTVMLVAAVLSTAGNLAGDTLGTPRVMHALGRDGALPRVLGRVHAKYATPAVAIGIYAAICATLAIAGTFRVLATLSASGTLCMYVVCCTGLLRLRARGVGGGDGTFVVPGGAVVPIAATLAVLLVLAGLDRRDFVLLGGVVVVVAIAAVAGSVRKAGGRSDR